jgi:hypothetical protein
LDFRDKLKRKGETNSEMRMVLILTRIINPQTITSRNISLLISSKPWMLVSMIFSTRMANPIRDFLSSSSFLFSRP